MPSAPASSLGGGQILIPSKERGWVWGWGGEAEVGMS